MRSARLAAIALAALCADSIVRASGPVGIYGIVEYVVFEPSEASPERIQVWGVFAYADAVQGSDAISQVKRGYLYFRLPAIIPGFTSQSDVDVVKTEWKDLKRVAGTGQAIAFGQWGYIGGFSGLQPDVQSSMPPYTIERAPRGGALTDLRVRRGDEPPTNPATYQTNAGIVKLPETGSHAAIVKQLRARVKF